jgi:hypothetical protein
MKSMPAKLISLLYVSKATQPPEPVEAIVEVALSRNAALDVTGALLFTGSHFAQVLEGPAEGVDELMVSILRDTRHRDVDVIETVEIPERRFAGWSLAYAGPSLFVDRHLRPLVEKRGGREQAAQLIRLMREFASG